MIEVRKGRPRSESARRAILEASRDLIAETGYDGMTIEAIAARAGVGRATIYRWWRSKATIVADAVIEGHIQLPPVVIPNTGSLAADLKAWTSTTSEMLTDSRAHQIVRALASAASEDNREADLLYEHITGPLYRTLVTRLECGRVAGQLLENSDPLAVADALIGTALFQTLTRQNAPERLTRVVDALLPPSPTPH